MSLSSYAPQKTLSPVFPKLFTLRSFKKILCLSISMMSMPYLMSSVPLYACDSNDSCFIHPHDPWHPGKTFAQVAQSTVIETLQGEIPMMDALQKSILTGEKMDPALQDAVNTYGQYLFLKDQYERVEDNQTQTNINRNDAHNSAMDDLRSHVTKNSNNPYLIYLYLDLIKQSSVVDFQETGANFPLQDQLILHQVQKNLLLNSLVMNCYVAVQNQAYQIALQMESDPNYLQNIKDTNPDASDAEVQEAADQFTNFIKTKAMGFLIPLWKQGHAPARDAVAQHLLHPANIAIKEIEYIEQQKNTNLRNLRAAREIIKCLEGKDADGVARCNQTIAHLESINQNLMQQQTEMIEKTQIIIKRYVPFMELNRSMQSFVLKYLSGRGIPENEPLWLGQKIMTAVGDHYGLKLADFLKDNQVNYEDFYNAVFKKLQNTFDSDLITATLTWKSLNNGTFPVADTLKEDYEGLSLYGYYETLATAIWMPSYFDLFFKDENIAEGTSKHQKAQEDQVAYYYKKLLELDSHTGRSDGREFFQNSYATYLINKIESYDALQQNTGLNLSNASGGQSLPSRLIKTLLNGEVVSMIFSTNQHYPENEQAGIQYTEQGYLENINKLLNLAIDGAPLAQSFLPTYLEQGYENPNSSVFNDMNLWEKTNVGTRLTLSFKMLDAIRFIEKNQSV